MADNTYQPDVGRRAGGSRFYMQGDGTFEQGTGTYFYFSDGVAAHTTSRSPLVYGEINTVDNANSTGITVTLPTPVAGAQIILVPLSYTTGQFYVDSASTAEGVDRVIGTSTEATGVCSDDNTIVGCTGPLVFRGINSSQWFLETGVGVTATTVGSSTA